MRPTIVLIEVVDKKTKQIAVGRFATRFRGANGIVDRSPTQENIETFLTKAGKLPGEIAWRIMRKDEMPPNRLFRDAWRSDGKRIAVDMAIARDMHRADIRKARDRMLAEKDAAWLREFSRGHTDAATAVEAERQILRDLPQAVEAHVQAATTPEALSAIWPAEIGTT